MAGFCKQGNEPTGSTQQGLFLYSVKHQLIKEESVSYRVSKKQKKRRLISLTWDWRLLISGIWRSWIRAS